MWERLAKFILRFRWALLILLVAATALMGYHASKVELSYEFARAIPTDNPKYQAYQAFRQEFGEDGNLLVVGMRTNQLFTSNVFNDYGGLVKRLKRVEGVEDVLSIPGAVNLVKDTVSGKMTVQTIFPPEQLSQEVLD